MKPDRPRFPRIRSIGIGFAAILALAGLGYFYQAIGAHRDLVAHPASGELIDIGGYRLHLACVGKGEPTVILIHGLGGNVYHWAQIQPALASTTRVCAYDRAGYGWSDVGPRPRSPLQNARELHALLENAGIGGPIVLVGHSYGTNLAQVYADQFPEVVRGLVLIDGGIAAEVAGKCPTLNCLPPIAQTGTDIFLRLQPGLFRVGLWRLLGFPQAYGENLKYLSSDQQAALIAGYGQTQSADTNLAEWQDWDNNVGLVGRPGGLGNIPIRALMADEKLPDWAYGSDPDLWRGYEQALLRELTRLSSDSDVFVLPDSDHASMLFNELQWQYVVTAVQQLVKLSRNQ